MKVLLAQRMACSRTPLGRVSRSSPSRASACATTNDLIRGHLCVCSVVTTLDARAVLISSVKVDDLDEVLCWAVRFAQVGALSWCFRSSQPVGAPGNVTCVTTTAEGSSTDAASAVLFFASGCALAVAVTAIGHACEVGLVQQAACFGTLGDSFGPQPVAASFGTTLSRRTRHGVVLLHQLRILEVGSCGAAVVVADCVDRHGHE